MRRSGNVSALVVVGNNASLINRHPETTRNAKQQRTARWEVRVVVGVSHEWVRGPFCPHGRGVVSPAYGAREAPIITLVRKFTRRPQYTAPASSHAQLSIHWTRARSATGSAPPKGVHLARANNGGRKGRRDALSSEVTCTVHHEGRKHGPYRYVIIATTTTTAGEGIAVSQRKVCHRDSAVSE